MHGGSVHASSEGLGKGSQFVVSLPVVRDAKPALARGPEPALGKHDQRPRVLVVDDNRDAADSLRALFEMESCKLATATATRRSKRSTSCSPTWSSWSWACRVWTVMKRPAVFAASQDLKAF